MKKDIHPKNYRPVLFIDNSNGAEFVLPSTVETEGTAMPKSVKKDKGTLIPEGGYPVYHLEISSASHPFYTGNEKILDTAGRVEKFKARQAKAKKKVKS